MCEDTATYSRMFNLYTEDRRRRIWSSVVFVFDWTIHHRISAYVLPIILLPNRQMIKRLLSAVLLLYLLSIQLLPLSIHLRNKRQRCALSSWTCCSSDFTNELIEHNAQPWPCIGGERLSSLRQSDWKRVASFHQVSPSFLMLRCKRSLLASHHLFKRIEWKESLSFSVALCIYASACLFRLQGFLFFGIFIRERFRRILS